ncbi:MAG: CDP-diacylglycerol--serine O-phosphatidyltransferase, partial [Marinobacter psychrophilus]
MTDEKKSTESNPANKPDVSASAGKGTEDVHELPPGEVIEEELVGGAPVRHKGIFLLPNALTTASLFSGFYAIVSAANGIFDNAAIAIFVSMILDGLDGRVARMTNTQSKFGEEYDSLADMVAFGVAPGLVAFFWSLNGLGK